MLSGLSWENVKILWASTSHASIVIVPRWTPHVDAWTVRAGRRGGHRGDLIGMALLCALCLSCLSVLS